MKKIYIISQTPKENELNRKNRLIFASNYSNIVTGGENMLKTHLVLMDELNGYRNIC